MFFVLFFRVVALLSGWAFHQTNKCTCHKICNFSIEPLLCVKCSFERLKRFRNFLRTVNKKHVLWCASGVITANFSPSTRSGVNASLRQVCGIRDMCTFDEVSCSISAEFARILLGLVRHRQWLCKASCVLQLVNSMENSKLELWTSKATHKECFSLKRKLNNMETSKGTAVNLEKSFLGRNFLHITASQVLFTCSWENSRKECFCSRAKESSMTLLRW